MKILRIILSAFLIFCIVITCFFYRKITGEITIKTPKEYKGILTVWNIDVFEGGKGSRTEFLKWTSRQYEKKNNGVLIMVINHTEESAREQIKNGIIPDIISYGIGVDLTEIKELKIDCAIPFGKVGEKVFAVPWCRGGYVVIENPNYKQKDNSLVVSVAKYNKPLVAYALNDLGGYNLTLKQSMDAYISFTAGKYRYMLGTQRDVIRLRQRGMECEYKPLSVFSDLYQYLSITSTSNEKYQYLLDFVSHVLSEKVQKELYKIGMMSAFYKVPTENDVLDEMQNQTINYTVSPFLSKENLSNIDTLTNPLLSGESMGEEKIKKILAILEKNNKI